MSDRPLGCDVVGGELRVTIGIERLAWAAEQRNGGPLRRGFRVVNPAVFAEDVARAFMRDNDAGNTLLSDVVEKAIQLAADYGSTGLHYPKLLKGGAK